MRKESVRKEKKTRWQGGICVALLCSFCMTTAVFAGQWKRDSYGYWYDYGDATYAKDWQKVDGNWYYFGSNGYMCTGWQNIADKWYYMAASGPMQKGWQFINGKWYYLGEDGSMRTGWQKLGDSWYYMEPSGAMHTSWLNIGNKRYYLDEDGRMQTGSFSYGSFQYMTDASGAIYRNTMIESMKFDEDGCIMMRNREGKWEYVPDLDELIERKKDTLADDLWERRYHSEQEFREDVRSTLENFVSEEEIRYVIEEAIAQFEKDYDMSYNAYIRRYGRKKYN